MNTKILSYFAFASLVAAFLALPFAGFEVALLAVAVTAFVILIAAMDYAPRRCYSCSPCHVGDRSERLPLAG